MGISNKSSFFDNLINYYTETVKCFKISDHSSGGLDDIGLAIVIASDLFALRILKKKSSF